MIKDKFFLFVLFVLVSCTQNKGQEIKSLNNFKNFPKEIQAEVTLVTPLDQGHGMVIKDSVIYYRTDNPKSSNLLEAYDMTTKTSHSVAKYGSGKGAFLGLMSFGLLNETIWGYDMTQKKVAKIPIDDSSNIEEIFFDNWHYSTVLLKNNSFLATGGIDLKQRLRIYDLTSKQFNDLIDFVPAPDNIPEDAWRLANESFLFYNENENIAALAYRYTDKVEFINLTSKSNSITFGPDQFDPKFDVIKQQGRNYIQRNEDTKFAFNGVGFVSRKYFYLSICNHQHESIHRDLAKDIYVYSSLGEPKLHVKLPFYISGIHVINDSEVLVYAPSERGIYRFNISL